MIKYTPFDLPVDGRTKLAGLDSWDARGLETEGFSLVGAVEFPAVGSESGIKGVYRLSESDALTLALKKQTAAEKKQAEAETEKAELAARCKALELSIADMVAARDEEPEC